MNRSGSFHQKHLLPGITIVLSCFLLNACATSHELAGYARQSYNRQSYDYAIQYAQLAVEEDPSYGTAWTLLGMAYAKKGQFDEAIAALKKAADLRFFGSINVGGGLHDTPTFWLGYAYYYKGQPDEAIRLFMKAVESRGDLEASHYWLSEAYYLKGDHLAAKLWCDRGLELMKDSGSSYYIPYFYYNRSANHLCLGFFSHAIADSVSYIERAGSNPSAALVSSAYRIRALAYAGIGDVAAAEQWLQRAKSTKPDYDVEPDRKVIGYAVHPGPIQSTVDNLAKSSPLLVSFLKAVEERKRFFLSVDTAEKNGEFRKAFNLCVAYYAARPDIITLKRIISLSRMIEPLPAIPEEARRHAVYADTAVREARDNKGYDMAISEFKEVVRLAPWWYDQYYNLGLVYEKRGDFSRAADSLNLYLLAVPNTPDREALKNKIYEFEFKSGAGRKK